MDTQLEAWGRGLFYGLGPLVAGDAPGNDYIASGIGNAMLCYAAPKEHIGFPRREDAKVGVATYRLAAPAANRNHPRDAFIAAEGPDAETGMKAMSEAFKEKGGDIYLRLE